MAHIFHMEEWQSNGKWLCGDVSALAADSNYCWYPAVILDLTPIDFVHELINTYHAVDLHYTAKYDVLIYKFSTLEDCRKFKNTVNRKAREKNFYNY